MSKLWDTRSSNPNCFSFTGFKCSSCIAKELRFKSVSAFYEILKSFQVITINLRRFRLRKWYFGVLAVKYKKKTCIPSWPHFSVKDLGVRQFMDFEKEHSRPLPNLDLISTSKYILSILSFFPMVNLNNAYCPCNADIKQDQSISRPNLKMLMLSENVCF